MVSSIPLTHSTHRLPDDHFHTDIAYAVIADEPPHHAPEEGESTNIQTFSRQELINLPADKIIENVREMALYGFDSILDTWQPVEFAEFL